MDNLNKNQEIGILNNIKKISGNQALLKTLFNFTLNHWSTINDAEKRNFQLNSQGHIISFKIRYNKYLVSKNYLKLLLQNNINQNGINSNNSSSKWDGALSNQNLLDILPCIMTKYFIVISHHLPTIDGVQEASSVDAELAVDNINFTFVKKQVALRLLHKSYFDIDHHNASTQHSLRDIFAIANQNNKLGKYLTQKMNWVNHHSRTSLCIMSKSEFLRQLKNDKEKSLYSDNDIQKHLHLLQDHKRIRYFGAVSKNGLPKILSRDDAKHYLHEVSSKV